MNKIIITGVTSFIGVSLINELIKRDVKIYAVIRPNSHRVNLLPSSNKISIIQVDMSDYEKLDSYIHESCDCFVNLAWDGTRGSGRMNKEIQLENFNGAIKAVNSALRLKCKKFISAGSQAEYGSHNCIISEETPSQPITEYGKQKLRFYEYATRLCCKTKMRFIEPRFFSLYGPGDFESTLISSTIQKMLKNEDCEFTEATQIWDFLYIKDAIDALLCLIESDHADGIYNFANGGSRQLHDFIMEMKQICNSNSNLYFGSIPYKSEGKVDLFADVSKLKKETNWTPKTDFKDGIIEVISFCRRMEKNENY